MLTVAHIWVSVILPKQFSNDQYVRHGGEEGLKTQGYPQELDHNSVTSKQHYVELLQVENAIPVLRAKARPGQAN